MCGGMHEPITLMHVMYLLCFLAFPTVVGMLAMLVLLGWYH